MKNVCIVVSGVFLVTLLIILLHSCLRRTHIPGYLVGSNNPVGLVSVSLSDGVVRELFPQDTVNAYSPAIDADTSMVYYVDRTLGTLMSYTIGAEAPKQLHAWPLRPSPVVSQEFFSPTTLGIHWLLLHPDHGRLFFLENHGGGKPVDLIEYSLHTGQRRLVLRRSLPPAQRPAWIDPDHLLLLLQDWSLSVLNIHTGELDPLLLSGGNFAVSYDGQYLLVNPAAAPYHASKHYDLYEFPSLQRLQSLPEDMFTKEVKSFCFADNDHVVFVMQNHLFSISTYILSLQTLKFHKLTGHLNNPVYVPESRMFTYGEIVHLLW